MFKNNFKTAWRSLFKNKFHTAINIFGMLTGFTVGLVLLLMVYSQFGFDSFHNNKNRIYQLYNEFYTSKEKTDISTSFGFPAASVYKTENPAVEKASRFLYGGNNARINEKEIELPVNLVDEDFFSIFTFPVVAGNSAAPLHDLSDIVLTETAAKNSFGTTNAVGKTISSKAGGDWHTLTVSAVVKDFPASSSIKFDALARTELRTDFAKDKDNWNNQHHPVFVMLKNGSTKEEAEQQFRFVNKKFLAEWSDGLKKNGAAADKNGDYFATKMEPLLNLHFSKVTGGPVQKPQLYTLLAIGLLIILIACFNFININLATVFTRSREIAVRKCLGAGTQNLFAQLWSESFLICLIAFIASLLLVNTAINYISRFGVKIFSGTPSVWQPGFLLLAIALLLFVSLLAGGYPSWVMTKLRVTETLKGKLKLNRKSVLRNALIVLQFTIACIMISSTYVIYSQFRHLQNADMGINKDFVISVPLFNVENGRANVERLRQRLAANPGVLSVTGSNINIGMGKDNSQSKSTTGFDYKDKSITLATASVDYDYLKTFGLKPLEGRDFEKSRDDDSAYHVLLSESAAKQFGEKNIAGMTIITDSTMPAWNIAGVFPDFHLYSLHEERRPLALVLSKSDPVRYCFIKVNRAQALHAMDAVKAEMAVIEPGREFRGSFVDENINNWYKAEKAMSMMFGVAAIVAIVLSCLGLLAMVLLVVQQRVKEIGVRKVLGAGVQQISFLISKEFLILVAVAVLIATPVSWLIMNKWLEDFPYRITLHWWMFALVAAAAFIITIVTIGFNTVKAAMQNPVKSLRTE